MGLNPGTLAKRVAPRKLLERPWVLSYRPQFIRQIVNKPEAQK